MIERWDGFWSIHQAGRRGVKQEPKDTPDNQDRADKMFGYGSH